MLDLGTLRIKIDADNKEADKNIQQTKESSKKSFKEVKQAFTKVIDSVKNGVANAQKGFKKVGEVVKGVGTAAKKVAATAAKAMAATAASVTAAATAIFSLVNSATQAGDEIDKQSQKFKTSAENYQALQFAAEHCGIEMEAFKTAAAAIQNLNLDNLSDLSKSFVTAAQQSGVATDDIGQMINALMGVEDVSQRSQIAMELFGGEVGLQLQPLLNGSESIEDYKNQLKDLGGLMSNESVKASAHFQDSLTDLKTSFGGIKNELAVSFLPIVEKAISFFTDNSSGISEFIGGVGSGLTTMAENGLEKVSTAITNVFDFIDQHKEDIKAFIGTVLAVFDNVKNALSSTLKPIIENFFAFISENKDSILGFISSIGTIISTVIQAAQPILQAIFNVISAIVGFILEHKDIIVGIITAIINVISSIATAIITVVSGVINAVKGIIIKAKLFLYKAKRFGKNLIDGFLNGIKTAWENVTGWIQEKIDWVKEKFNSIKDSIAGLFGGGNTDGSHRTGLREVPYDNYVAELHKGEMVLTAAEANQYQKNILQQSQPTQSVVVNNYSPKSLDEAETARLYRKSIRNMKLGVGY